MADYPSHDALPESMDDCPNPYVLAEPVADHPNSDALPEPWVLGQEIDRNGKASTCFSNPNTGQKFYRRKDLDQYLAFSRKYKLPRECKWETPDVGSSSRSIDRRAKTKSKSKGKNRTKGKGIAKAKSKEKGIPKAKLKPKGDIAKAKPEARASGHR
ncbi:hypothetical protein Nepgr_024331 [Nepenthes gracilis]|uniref:MBD domain-containing protein n=1 Tax=Nepenthes gracilis TaxID=150966 RepID=A0AAD3T2M4_NEPGR|nr:hypothetical protein Nepgr_024331 [Nepenthes gracilis]